MKRDTDFKRGALVFVFVYGLCTHLEFVLAALGAEGMGAADEEQFLGRQVRRDADVILALVLKSRKCQIFYSRRRRV